MKKIVTIGLVLLCLPGAFAAMAADVQMPPTITAGNGQLILNGEGWLKKFGIKGYLGGLYLAQKSSDGAAIVEANEPMAIRMHTVRGIGERSWVHGWEKSFSNKTRRDTSKLQKEIAQFQACFKGGTQKGDVLLLMYLPESGLTVSKNDQAIGTVPGLEFKQAFFDTFFGNAADAGLRNEMLGLQ